MRHRLLVSLSLVAASSLLVVWGCSDSDRRGGGGGGDMPAVDLGPGADLAPCTGIACNVPACTGMPATSISGTVYDPAGTTPLYNVAVYVPNAPLADIPDGIDVTQCSACPAPLSGEPIVTTLTDSHGAFTLKNVPAGSNVPLVIQAGKFRRAIMVPLVEPCTDNPVGAKDSMNAETMTRLPRNQTEGHLPLIAIATGGCEGLECVVRAYGFSDSEFTTSSGTGRIHLYTGNGGGKAAGGSGDQTEAYKFWGSTTAMNKYDMILNSCECGPYPRDTFGPAYDNMKTYLDHGGRLFASDYQYSWFADMKAPADFQSSAKWMVNQAAPRYMPPFLVDTSFPKGQALDDWLQFVFKGMSPPPDKEINLDPNYILYNVDQVNPGTTRWIYSSSSGTAVPSTASTYTVKYMSFNTPFNAGTVVDATQCGRAVFADLHVSSNITSTTFPLGCETLTKNQQVTAFEFLFFDIGSCVQDDTKPVAPPPIL